MSPPPFTSIMVLVAATLNATSDAFTSRPPVIPFSSVSSTPTATRGALGASSDPVEVLSDYMTKSHEEKLRAIKSVEDQKNMEISALKAEIERLRSSAASAAAAAAAASPSSSYSSAATATASSPPNDNNNMEIAEMQSKLESYQSFMAQYIVDSQNQKMAAVKEAENRVEKKFTEKIEQLLLSNGGSVNGIGGMSVMSAAVATPPATATAATGGGEQSLFQKRNNQIVRAADANKSRWGGMEIDRAREQLLVAQSSIPSVFASSAPSSRAADATTLFDRRNAQVIASAAAGKSRWGDMEVERAMKNGVVVNVNGSGSVGSGGEQGSTDGIVVTLEERVNLGARLLGARTL